MFVALKIEGVENLLSDDNIGRNMPVSNQSWLGLIYVAKEVVFEAVGQEFSDNFVNNIAEAYRSEMFRGSRLADFWYKSNEGIIYIWR